MMSEAVVVSILAIIGFIVWLVRLEGRINYHEKLLSGASSDIDSLRVKVETIDSDLVKELTEIKITLAKIEGFLAIHKESK